MACASNRRFLGHAVPPRTCGLAFRTFSPTAPARRRSSYTGEVSGAAIVQSRNRTAPAETRGNVLKHHGGDMCREPRRGPPRISGIESGAVSVALLLNPLLSPAECFDGHSGTLEKRATQGKASRSPT